MPSALGEEGIYAIPEYGRQLMQEIEFFLVENERSARRFLRAIGYKKNFDEVRMISIEQAGMPVSRLTSPTANASDFLNTP